MFLIYNQSIALGLPGVHGEIVALAPNKDQGVLRQQLIMEEHLVVVALQRTNLAPQTTAVLRKSIISTFLLNHLIKFQLELLTSSFV